MERYPLGSTTWISIRPTAFQYLRLWPRPRKKILLFPEMRVTRKILTGQSRIFFFFFKWIWLNFLNSLHIKNYANSTFLCWKTKSPTFCCTKRKNVSSYEWMRYWNTALMVDSSDNVCDYGFKTQSLTWTSRCWNLKIYSQLAILKKHEHWKTFFWDSWKCFRQCSHNNQQGTKFDHFNVKSWKAGVNRIYR